MIDDEQKHNAKNISPSDSRNNSTIKNFNKINYNYMPFQQNYLNSTNIDPINYTRIYPENLKFPLKNPQSNPEPIDVQTPSTQISYIPELIPITSIDISQSNNGSQILYVPETIPVDSIDNSK